MPPIIGGIATYAIRFREHHEKVKSRDCKAGASTCHSPDQRTLSDYGDAPVKDQIEARAPRIPERADPLSFCNNASLRKATRRLGKLYDAVLEPSGLKATQCSLLTQIHALGHPTMAGLANSLLMDLSAMRHSLGPLIRDGLVLLRVDAKDRRVKRVVLTAAGLAKFKETMRLWRKAQGRFEKAFGSARAAKLRSELKLLTSDGFEEAF
jgi:DNA-binding MarR family transcriptional regulator